MRVRSIGAAVLLVGLAACGGGPSATSSTTSGPAGATSGTSGTASAAPATPGGGTIDLSGLDACTLLDMAAVEALTGETGFDMQRTDGGPSGDKCFWAVPRPGVPQFVEVSVGRRASLDGYGLNINGIACPSTALSGAGVDAVGGVCVSPQKRVFLAALDQGVAVEVSVNEPKGPLTPEDLLSVAKTVLDGLTP